jgi:MFS family permease
MIGFIVGAVSWLLVGLPDRSSGHLVFPLCMWVGGFALSMTNPLVLTFVSKSYPKDTMGKISGIITGASASGTLAGLAVGSYALHVTGMYQAVILLVGIGSFMGFLSASFLSEPKPC